MRLLILSPNYANRYASTFEHFRQAVARQADCVFCGPSYPGWSGPGDILPVIEERGPFDAVVVFHLKYAPGEFLNLSKVTLPKAAVVVDYLIHNYAAKNAIIRALGFDAVFLNQSFSASACTQTVRAGGLQKKLKVYHLPFSVDPAIFERTQERYDARAWDAVAIFSTQPRSVYRRRDQILREMAYLKEFRIFARSANRSQDRITGADYISLLNDTRILVGSGSQQGCVTLRCFEAPACGAVIVTSPGPDLGRLGFVHGETCLIYHEVKELRALVSGSLMSGHLERIAQNGYQLIQDRHTVDIRSTEFLRCMEGVI